MEAATTAVRERDARGRILPSPHAFALPEEDATSAPDDRAAAADFGAPEPPIRPPP
jgi:hypothetical protein